MHAKKGDITHGAIERWFPENPLLTHVEKTMSRQHETDVADVCRACAQAAMPLAGYDLGLVFHELAEDVKGVSSAPATEDLQAIGRIARSALESDLPEAQKALTAVQCVMLIRQRVKGLCAVQESR